MAGVERVSIILATTLVQVKGVSIYTGPSQGVSIYTGPSQLDTTLDQVKGPLLDYRTGPSQEVSIRHHTGPSQGVSSIGLPHWTMLSGLKWTTTGLDQIEASFGHSVVDWLGSLVTG